ncbi:hypothetical protein J2853_001470 [Streptosporangium lutulentum]|uniref:HTH araC/xylS-type domain-containing protein n=1 Tax=Streptosporangium lutulentum TaxID=1461250 RepID=A0ABT9Q8H6_9ACTN|nr:hypothetical protein [Streptosporangium lutulentum]
MIEIDSGSSRDRVIASASHWFLTRSISVCFASAMVFSLVTCPGDADRCLAQMSAPAAKVIAARATAIRSAMLICSLRSRALATLLTMKANMITAEAAARIGHHDLRPFTGAFSRAHHICGMDVHKK